MLYDCTVQDASFVDGRGPAGIQELLSWSRDKLGLDGSRKWRLISARRKLGKILFEIEEQTPSGAKRLIGKFGKTERADSLYRTLRSLREAGFAPPNLYTVPEPVAFVPELGFVLQEKVPGKPALHLLTGSNDESISAARACAGWLRNLHQAGVAAAVSKPDLQFVSDWAADLAAEQLDRSAQIYKIAEAIQNELRLPASKLLPSHGDFHPMNIFIAGTERVTGIDMDKYALREPEADIGWFLTQTAGLGFFEKRSFSCTEHVRRMFLDEYQAGTASPIQPRRVALYMAMVFIKNLHFELVLLKTGRTEYVAPWLKAAAAAILEGNLHLSP
jgi:aminoglycoside phosphotransferase (APT) family kinase protein